MGFFGLGSAKKAEGVPQPGQFGPYYLQELINSGGAANIWLATNQKHDHYALRRLHHHLRFDATSKRRFLRGCEILSKIHDHEHVITYYEHGKIEGDLYLLMEYVEGANLKQLISRSDPLLTEFIGNILIDAAIGLEHVHESGFIHLDFKPENVLITRNGNVRLVDFDIAQPRPEKPKRLSENPGTPAYMAPEQLRGREVDHRADIFAFGVTAYEMLTFRKPFSGETPKEILISQFEQEQGLVLPRDLNADIPASLEKVVLRCIAREADERYPFASVLVRELEAALYV